MATNVVLADGVQPGSTSATLLYTSPSALASGTRIIGFTANNPSATTQNFSVWIVPAGGSPDDTNIVLKAVPLTQNYALSPPEVQNQLIPAGGFLYASVSSATTINFRGSGIEF